MSVSQTNNCFYGQLSQFDSDQETMSAYLERVEIFFQANNIAEEKQVGIFLSLIGAKTYGLLRDLVAPAKPKEKTLAELTEALRTHFEPQPLIIAERFYFNQRNQLPNESIADYMATLRKMATSCKFNNFLDEALRDRFVSGIRSTSIQKRLLTEEKLSSAEALQLAQSMETAQNSSTKLHGTRHLVFITLVCQATVDVDGVSTHHQVVQIRTRAKLVIAVEVNIYLLTVDLVRLYTTNATRKGT